jgi:hypothetical protein
METKKIEAFDELIAFRAFSEDKNDLIAVARDWQLDEAEIARRALRAGLQVLRKFKVPGCREERKRF